MKKTNFLKYVKIITLLVLIKAISYQAHTSEFVEVIPVYGVIKPGQMTTLLAVNHGMVLKIKYDIGDSVKVGNTILEVIEKETTRSYRTTINGQIAKLHVTPGAALTPGMPLITIINPDSKKIEVSLSPQEASKVKIGNSVYLQSSNGDLKEVFAKISKISPLVDPDNGAVMSYIKPVKELKSYIGDILSLNLSIRTIKDCKVVLLSEVDQYSKDYNIEATSGQKVCLTLKK